MLTTPDVLCPDSVFVPYILPFWKWRLPLEEFRPSYMAVMLNMKDSADAFTALLTPPPVFILYKQAVALRFRADCLWLVSCF